jgi:hypothetical protein
MNTTARKTLVLVICVLVLTVMVAGCQDEQKQTNAVSNDQMNRLAEVEKMSKLIAAQNVDLKKQLEEQPLAHARELQAQRKRHEKEMKRQKTLLDRCMQQNESYEELSREGVESYMSNIAGPLVDENEKLRKENEALKVQVQDLQGQVDRLKAE